MNNKKAGITVDVYSDVICPWCYIGKSRLDEAIKLLEDDIDVKVEWKTYQLNASMPSEGIDREKYLINKYGNANITAVQQQVSKAASQQGLSIDLNQIKRIPNTLKAHRLLSFAKQYALQEIVLEIMYRKFFYYGQDLGSTEVLVSCAALAGLPTADVTAFLNSDESLSEVQADEEAAFDMGISAVPTFVVGEQIIAAGTESATELASLLKKAASKNAAN